MARGPGKDLNRLRGFSRSILYTAVESFAARPTLMEAFPRFRLMPTGRISLVFALLPMVVQGSVVAAQAEQTVTQKIAGMERKDGYFPLDWDVKAGKLYLEVTRLDEDFLLLDQLPYGLGSNDVGLDRGQLGQGRVVHFSRVGGKVLLIAPNLRYRSS